MTHDQILLHLSLIEDAGPAAIKNIVERMPEGVRLQDLYGMSDADVTQLFHISPLSAQKIVAGLASKRRLERELELITTFSISWMPITSDQYPLLLKAIHLPPAILYWRGTLPTHDRMIAFVGARRANEYAQLVIAKLVPALVAHGWVIVSGGALGADAMAHQATMDVGGKTVVVLGSGLLRPSPGSHMQLFDNVVSSGGAVISSFPLEMEALPGHFPARNRIISGLSRGVVVVQAADKSGTRITADCALEQGRDVFAIPGSIDDELSSGCHALIQDGAKLVHSVADILREYGQDPIAQPFKPAVRDQEMPVPEIDESPESRLKNLIVRSCAQPMAVDELLNLSGLSLGELNALLFDLQLNGFIEQNFMGKWKRCG